MMTEASASSSRIPLTAKVSIPASRTAIFFASPLKGMISASQGAPVVATAVNTVSDTAVPTAAPKEDAIL